MYLLLHESLYVCDHYGSVPVLCYCILYSGKFLQNIMFTNFVDAVKFPKSFFHKCFALAKPHCLQSIVVTTSSITAINEVVKKTIYNNTGPGEKETLGTLGR